MEREDDGIENEFPQLKARIEELNRIIKTEHQSSKETYEMIKEISRKFDIISFKADRISDYSDRIAKDREESEKKGIFERPEYESEVSDNIIDELERSIKELEKLIEACEKKMKDHEEDINDYPSDISELKDKIQSFTSKNPSYQNESDMMLKIINEVEKNYEVLVKKFNVSKQLLEDYKSGKNQTKEFLTKLRSVINLEISLKLNLFYLHHPEEIKKRRKK